MTSSKKEGEAFTSITGVSTNNFCWEVDLESPVQEVSDDNSWCTIGKKVIPTITLTIDLKIPQTISIALVLKRFFHSSKMLCMPLDGTHALLSGLDYGHLVHQSLQTKPSTAHCYLDVAGHRIRH